MTTKPRLAKIDLFSTGIAYQRAQPRMRNLGGAILWVAILDYRSLDREAPEDRQDFLFRKRPSGRTNLTGHWP